MKLSFLVILGANLCALAFTALTWYMIANDKPYWGWVLTCAVLCVTTVGTRKNGETETEKSI